MKSYSTTSQRVHLLSVQPGGPHVLGRGRYAYRGHLLVQGNLVEIYKSAADTSPVDTRDGIEAAVARVDELLLASTTSGLPLEELSPADGQVLTELLVRYGVALVADQLLRHVQALHDAYVRRDQLRPAYVQLLEKLALNERDLANVVRRG